MFGVGLHFALRTHRGWLAHRRGHAWTEDVTLTLATLGIVLLGKPLAALLVVLALPFAPHVVAVAR